MEEAVKIMKKNTIVLRSRIRRKGDFKWIVHTEEDSNDSLEMFENGCINCTQQCTQIKNLGQFILVEVTQETLQRLEMAELLRKF